MISGDLRFEGFDARSWTNLLSLFSPGVIERLERDSTASDAPEIDATTPAEPASGSLVIVRDDEGRVLTAMHTLRGRVVGIESAQDLTMLCREYSADRVLVLREGVVDELAERLALRLQRGDDYVTQWIMLLRATRELMDAGHIRLWPNPVANVPVPSPGTVRRALDLVLPDDRAAIAVLWDRGEIWTGAALRRRAGAIDLVAGPDLLHHWAGPLGGDWRRDYRILGDAVARAVAPVHVGLFAEVRTIQQLLRSPDPGAWVRAVAVRDIILHPTPPYVAVAVGADAVRAVARGSAKVLGGIDLFRAVSPIADYVRSRVSEVTSVTATLGFNPLRVLAQILRREEPQLAPVDDPPRSGRR